MVGTLRTLSGYLGGAALLLLGLLLLIGAPPVGLVVIGLGLFVFPPFRGRFSLQLSTPRLAAWVVGVVLVLFGTVAATEMPVAGAFGIAAGLVALPLVRDSLATYGNVEPRNSVVALVVLVGATASMGLVATGMDTTAPRGNVTHEMGESFTVNKTEHTELRVNVTGAETFVSAVPAGRETPVTPVGETFLAIYVTFENLGNETVTLDGRGASDVGLVHGPGDDAQPPSFNAEPLEYTEQVDGDVFDLYNDDLDVEPDEQRRGALVYDVESNQQYYLKLTPGDADLPGDNHYVRLLVSWPT
jgi:hypothetical protein